MVDVDPLCIQLLRLGQGARHPVQNEAVYTVGLKLTMKKPFKMVSVFCVLGHNVRVGVCVSVA
jgi:hypothetical protein